MGRSTRGGKMATSLRTMKLARRKRSETLVSNDLCSLLPVPRQTCSFDFVGHRSDGAIGTQVFEATLFCSLRDTTFHHFSRVTHSLLRWDKIHHLGAAFFLFSFNTLFPLLSLFIQMGRSIWRRLPWPGSNPKPTTANSSATAGTPSSGSAPGSI